MRIITIVFGGMVVAGWLLIAGCEHERRVVVEREHHPVVEERPVVVHERPAEVIIVREAPPREVVEIITPAPGPDFVWIGGYYIYSDHHYVWIRGHYERPPHHGANWESPRWTHEGDGWHHHEGKWH